MGSTTPPELNVETSPPRCTFMGRREVGIFEAACWLIMILLLVYHGMICWNMIGGWAGLHSKHPILTHDHTFNYYYAVTSRAYLANGWSNAGYDPYFMSGYAKSIIYPSSSTLVELVVFLFGGDRPSLAYNLYVIGGGASLPFLVLAAAMFWSNDRMVWLLATGLYVIYFWTDWAMHYLQFGMVAFALAGPMSLLATGAFFHWLRNAAGSLSSGPGARWRSRLSWAAATLAAGFMAVTHLTTPIAVSPAFLVMTIAAWRRLSWSTRLAMPLFALGVIALNLFWLLPGVLLWSTKGDTAVVFTNPNVVERLVDLVTIEPVIQRTLLALSFVGLAAGWRRDRMRSAGLAATLAWTFTFGYLAGWFPSLDFMQPGRYTLFVYTWGTLIAALGWTHLASMFSVFWRRALVAGCVIAAVWLWGQPLFDLYRQSAAARGQALPTRMPEFASALLDLLRERTKPGDRLLFEECNRGVNVQGRTFEHPMGALRLSPLIPLETGLEVIGGPYLYTHQRTNFTQFGDGNLFGRQGFPDPAAFHELASCYDVDWILFWSPLSRQYFGQMLDRVQVVAKLGVFPNEYILAKYVKGPSPLCGKADVTVSPGKIQLENIRAEEGVLEIPYHWTPRLVSKPPVEIAPVTHSIDPIPFISVRNPPDKLTIYLQPLPWIEVE